MEYLNVTVYPDADAAAYKWPETTKNTNTTEPYPLSIVTDAIETYNNEELSIDYRAGYLYGTVCVLREWLSSNAVEPLK